MVMTIEDIEEIFKYVVHGEEKMMVWTGEHSHE